MSLTKGPLPLELLTASCKWVEFSWEWRSFYEQLKTPLINIINTLSWYKHSLLNSLLSYSSSFKWNMKAYFKSYIFNDSSSVYKLVKDASQKEL